jgi:hypothetical protein
LSDENENRNDGEWNSLLALAMASLRRSCREMESYSDAELGNKISRGELEFTM